MTASKDKAGRPVRRRHRAWRGHLAWRRQDRQLGKAHRRRIRHPRHHPLSHRRLEDPHRRHHRFPAGRSACRRRSVGALRRPRRRRSHRRNPASAPRRFPRPAVSRGAADRDGMAAAPRARARSPAPTTRSTYDDLLRASGEFPDYHRRFLFGSVADHLAEKFGTKGSPISLSTACASGATAIQLGVEAIRRGETDAALCIGTDGSINPEAADPLFAAVGAFDQQRRAAKAREAVFQKPRRLRHGRRRRRPGAGKLRGGQGARRQNSRRPRRLRRNGRLPSIAPARARTASRSSAASPMPSTMPASRPTISTTSTRTAPARRKTTRWNISASSTVFGERHEEPADLLQQIDDRPYAVGRRRGGSGVHASHSATANVSRRPSTTTCPIRQFRSTSCPTPRATPACATRYRTRSALAGRTFRW